MISSTIASALAPSTPSQPQDACSLLPAATDGSGDSASFSSAMANAKAASSTGDTSNAKGGDAPKETPADNGQGESAANPQTAVETSSSRDKTATTNATSRTMATSRAALSTEQSCAGARAPSTAENSATSMRTVAAEDDGGNKRQASAKDQSDKPTSGSEVPKVGITPTTDSSATVCGTSLAPADANVDALVQAATAQTIRADLTTSSAGERAAPLSSTDATLVGLRASTRVDAAGAEDISTAQAESQTVPAPGLVSGANTSATGTVQSFASVFARSAKAEGESTSGNTSDGIGDFVLANGGTPPVSSSTAALTSLAGAPIPGSAALGLGPTQVDISTRVGDSGFGQDVSQQLVFLAKTGAQSAQLSLHPAELGPVSVSIQMNGLQASLVISASHAATRAALQEALPHLGELFQSSGLQLADAQVGDGSTRDADQGATQRHAIAIDGPLGPAAGARATTIGASAAAGSPVAGSRLIDTFA